MLCKFCKCSEMEDWECTVTGKKLVSPCDDTIWPEESLPTCYSPLDADLLPAPQPGYLCLPCLRQRDKVGATLDVWCKDCNPPEEVY